MKKQMYIILMIFILAGCNSCDGDLGSEEDSKLIYYNFEGSLEKSHELSDLKIFVHETSTISGNKKYEFLIGRC